ncbi:uncharacterized protein LOC128853141 isoform X3 [Cuculus canorus]|uniref:uncharacterized protein LOC128853140 isoform X3 n=1 Tax=Cuculus canorus TaxID=55661 RepID=UPI0023AA3BCD|nr:uncharacterized protein LOC128853140 isoform X3 [Cuculus canorus]XP_053931520.1 uncharacterized protein LOC128853141 isoform X3 [Cuculus canorus]
MAQMGVGEGKSIGEWFGPNTVAQVLKCRKHFVRKALCKSEVGSTTERELGTLQGVPKRPNVLTALVENSFLDRKHGFGVFFYYGWKLLGEGNKRRYSCTRL